MSDTAIYYGVSSGDGNNGVSHMFPNYVVKTNDPWRLAGLASVSCFKSEFQTWARDNVEIDGEAEYTISACFYSMPDDDEDCEHDYCPLIIEIFPWEGKLPNTPVFESLEAAFENDTLQLIAA